MPKNPFDFIWNSGALLPTSEIDYGDPESEFKLTRKNTILGGRVANNDKDKVKPIDTMFNATEKEKEDPGAKKEKKDKEGRKSKNKVKNKKNGSEANTTTTENVETFVFVRPSESVPDMDPQRDSVI